jgi:hypothetical protein
VFYLRKGKKSNNEWQNEAFLSDCFNQPDAGLPDGLFSNQKSQFG